MPCQLALIGVWHPNGLHEVLPNFVLSYWSLEYSQSIHEKLIPLDWSHTSPDIAGKMGQESFSYSLTAKISYPIASSQS